MKCAPEEWIRTVFLLNPSKALHNVDAWLRGATAARIRYNAQSLVIRNTP